ncbi:hypothetical protein [Alienimonas sp. DA493]|uniref:hypothetical protein n=1 Tax=Alienimonas sp. DA493 TaxID=3373605 RepID=UPI003754C04B
MVSAMYELPPAAGSEPRSARLARAARRGAAWLPTPCRLECWVRRRPRAAGLGLLVLLLLGAATFRHTAAAWQGHVARYQGHAVDFGHYVNGDLRRWAPLPKDFAAWFTPVAATYRGGDGAADTVGEFLDRLDWMPYVTRVGFDRATLSAQQAARAAARHTHPTLELRDCYVEAGGLEPLLSKPNLVRVSLRRCRLPDGELAALANAAGLEELDLTGGRGVGGALAALAGQPSLLRVLAEGADLNDASLDALIRCPAAVELNLARTDVTDAGLARLSDGGGALMRLSLAHTRVSDRGVAAMGLHPKLRALDLAGTAVTDAGLSALVQLCPNLNALSLRGTDVTDAGLVALADLPRLDALDLSDTAVTAAGLASLDCGGCGGDAMATLPPPECPAG